MFLSLCARFHNKMNSELRRTQKNNLMILQLMNFVSRIRSRCRVDHHTE